MQLYKTLFAFTVTALFFTACQKELTSQHPAIINSANNALAVADEVSSVFDGATGNTKLILRPNPKNGQDAWIEHLDGDPTHAESNTGSVAEFKMLAWTINGAPVCARSLIRFDSLSKVPAGKQLVSATLYLYGLTSSPVHLPQGNSYYPGSPYNYYGSNTVLVHKVTSRWKENTVTWNTQPKITAVGQSVIPASTSQWNYDVAVDVTDLVNTMLVSDGYTNYGFMLRLQDEAAYRSMGFYTSEASEAQKRPRLVVVYK